jgi:hypothetical protein
VYRTATWPLVPSRAAQPAALAPNRRGLPVSRGGPQPVVLHRHHELVGDVHDWLLMIMAGLGLPTFASPSLRLTAGQIDIGAPVICGIISGGGANPGPGGGGGSR